MERIEDVLRGNLEELNRLLEGLEDRLSNNNVDQMVTLRHSKKKNGFQYYMRYKDGTCKYIKKDNRETAQLLAQREYDLIAKKEIEKQKRSIEYLLKNYDMAKIKKIYPKMCKAKRELITPVIMTDEEFIANWLQQNKGGMNTYPEKGKYVTNNGEYVRSKSEKIIADLFHKNSIPYVYEPQLNLSKTKKVYPDFAVLNTKTRKTLYWEHLGIIDDGEYAASNLEKINLYEKAGYQLGHELIISMESGFSPLNIRNLEEKIHYYLN